MFSKIVSVLVLMLILSGCSTEIATETVIKDPIINDQPVIAKWFNNHTAAMSIGMDNMKYMDTFHKKVQNFMYNQKMAMDFEIVTEWMPSLPTTGAYIIDSLYTRGFQIFGHGHSHINHDQVSYDSCFKSFTLCYQTMTGIGIKPISYAYPQGAGEKYQTQLACASAGFLSARGFKFFSDEKYLIMPGESKEPTNWYYLPALVHYSMEADSNPSAIHNTEELIPHLDRAIAQKAWLISGYHNIGNPGNFGWYHFETFVSDMQAIKSRDFWIASMNDVTLYTRERAKTKISYSYNSKESILENIKITLSDGLDNNFFNFPLTVVIKIPESWLNKKIAITQAGVLVSEIVVNKTSLLCNLKPNEIEYTITVK